MKINELRRFHMTSDRLKQANLLPLQSAQWSEWIERDHLKGQNLSVQLMPDELVMPGSVDGWWHNHIEIEFAEIELSSDPDKETLIILNSRVDGAWKKAAVTGALRLMQTGEPYVTKSQTSVRIPSVPGVYVYDWDVQPSADWEYFKPRFRFDYIRCKMRYRCWKIERGHEYTGWTSRDEGLEFLGDNS